MSPRSKDVSSLVKPGVSFADAVRPSDDEIAKARALLARLEEGYHAGPAQKSKDLEQTPVLDISSDSDPEPLKSAHAKTIGKKNSLLPNKPDDSLRSPAQISEVRASKSSSRPRPRPVPRKIKSAPVVPDTDEDEDMGLDLSVKKSVPPLEHASSDEPPSLLQIFEELDAQKTSHSARGDVRKEGVLVKDGPAPAVQDDVAVLESLFAKAGKKKDFLLNALELLARKSKTDSGLRPDADHNSAIETRQLLQSLITTQGLKRGRDDGPTSSGIDKKGHDADASMSEDGLSDYERRELKRLRKSRPGPSQSKVSLIPDATPTTNAVDDDGKSVALPATPKRRVRKGVQDLIAAAGGTAVPATPASSPPPAPASSPSSTAGSIIESRLLSPPPTNELPLDMSDDVIRLTAKDYLYRLASHIFLKSWNENLMGPGFVKFVVWALQCPEMDGELALSFVTFEDDDCYGNLSRMDISKVYSMRVSQSATRYHAVTKDGRPFIFLTSGFLETSQLMTTSPVGMKQRFVKVIPHEGEHQRMGSAACTVFGFESMKTQYAKHALQFSTRAEYTPNNASSTSPGGKPVAAGMFTGASNANGSRVSMDSFSLPNTADVPIYDAREVDDFNVNKDLQYLSSKMPRFYQEIPYGSFVVVGYTMTAFFSSTREWTLGLNIQWVVLVGTPSVPE